MSRRRQLWWYESWTLWHLVLKVLSFFLTSKILCNYVVRKKSSNLPKKWKLFLTILVNDYSGVPCSVTERALIQHSRTIVVSVRHLLDDQLWYSGSRWEAFRKKNPPQKNLMKYICSVKTLKQNTITSLLVSDLQGYYPGCFCSKEFFRLFLFKWIFTWNAKFKSIVFQ